MHLKDFAKVVNTKRNAMILELGTGAGFGTSSILTNGFNNNCLITIEIDYACLGNAVGFSWKFCFDYTFGSFA